jgi:chromosome partitioning protein
MPMSFLSLSHAHAGHYEDKAIPGNYGIIRHAEGVDLLPSNIELSAFEVGISML